MAPSGEVLVHEIPRQPVHQRSAARACLPRGTIGDALGVPIEFLTLAQIRKSYGPVGATDFVEGDWPAESSTDDTQMTLFTPDVDFNNSYRIFQQLMSNRWRRRAI